MGYRAIEAANRIAEASPETALVREVVATLRERRKRDDPEGLKADLMRERERCLKRVAAIDEELAGLPGPTVPG